MRLAKFENTHIVLITSEIGVLNAFTSLKELLSEKQGEYITFIYALSSQNGEPLYKAELDNLQNRFTTHLQVKYITDRNPFLSDSIEAYQRYLEIEINCNISKNLYFKLFGSSELITLVTNRLQFLGIKERDITSFEVK